MQRLKTTAIGKLVIIDNNLFFIDGDWTLNIDNLCRSKENIFHQIAGWYIYPEPLDLTAQYEVEVLNNKVCHLIRKYERKST